MKILFLVIALFYVPLDEVTIVEIRNSYKICNESKENAEAFYELTEKALEKEGAIYKGYHGAALALKASFSWNPISKLSYFNKGRKLIDTAIQFDPEDIELRLIRLSIQSNVPKIVGYYHNIEEDRNFIVANIDKVEDAELKLYIENFMAYSDVFIQ
ncbi:hypothetical protein [Aquimarina pacifica]|uniref:hypothetical protein n=1 Tax=Aquimarina pacifica TaxID=1296415 RepID=UPI00046F6323|nr:hypothetical protein [Aquimarina pacifica]